MNRRSFLAGAAVGLAGGLAGCFGDESTEAECHLSHELVESDGDGDVVETYQYEELSEAAQEAVDRTVENGSYATTDRSDPPSEFRYWDEAATYEVVDGNETYVLRTYSGEGCEPE